MTDANRINAAIRECLDKCYASQTPLPCLAEYVDLLRADPTWREADVLEVEVAVRQMLKGIVLEPEGDGMSR
jgi:hypothetical protein